MAGGGNRPGLGGRHQFYHQVQLRGPVPSRVLHRPLYFGSPSAALTKIVMAASLEPQRLVNDPAAQSALDRFDWLEPLLAQGDDEAAQGAQALFSAWARRAGTYRPRPWAPGVTASRLVTMLRGLKLLLLGADGPLREQIFDSIARQGRHLRRTERRLGEGHDDALPVAISRALTALCLPEDRGLGPAIDPALVRVLTHLADGEIPRRWRRPSVALRQATDLIALQDAFADRRLTPPEELAEAVKTARLLVGALTTGPHDLAVLHADTAGNPSVVEAVRPVRRAEADRILEGLGLVRLSQGTVSALLDARKPPDHAGAGGIVLCADGEVIVTGCGAPSAMAAGLSPRMAQWRGALGSPAAASGPDLASLPPGETLVDRSGDGGLAALMREAGGLYHQRRVFLEPSGRLRGEDQALDQDGPPLYRFHLAPGVRATKGEAPESLILTLPSGSSWQFKTRHAMVSLKDSVYAGRDGDVVDTVQIVLKPEREGVRWAFEPGTAVP